MEIDFNTSRIAKPEITSPATRSATSPAATDTSSFTGAASLDTQLQSLPPTRGDQVALAKTLITNPEYPPQFLLDRIAALLAAHNLQ